MQDVDYLQNLRMSFITGETDIIKKQWNCANKKNKKKVITLNNKGTKNENIEKS